MGSEKLLASFSKKLREMREWRGLTQVEMAMKTKMARQTYLDLETGKTEPRLKTVYDFSLILKIDPAWLAGFVADDDKNKKPCLCSLYPEMSQALSTYDRLMTDRKTR